MVLRLPPRGREGAAGDAVLRRPLGQSQSVQGALARDSDALPRSPAAVSRRANALDDRHPGGGDGLASGGQAARDAASRVRLRTARLLRDARNGRDLEDHHRRHARAEMDRSRAAMTAITARPTEFLTGFTGFT